MLQISTGKFFESDDVYVHEGKGIIYSNYSWVLPIHTNIGTIEAVDTHGNITAYVFNYKNRMPKGGVLVKTGDHQIIEQFKLIFSFYFQCFSDLDRSAVEMNCRNTKRNMNDDFLPYEFAEKIFEPKIDGSKLEAEGFTVFLEKMIGLERKKYKKLIQCLEAYNNSLSALNYNFELAYSLLIYCLESLSQTFDGYIAQWEDYPQITKDKLENVFSELEYEKAVEIKKILIEDRHFKLQKRFVSFIANNIDDEYYIGEASGIKGTLRKVELEQVLRNAYDIRSKYVHSLQSIMEKQLKIPKMGGGEVLSWSGSPYLTYKGLLRLTTHIIKNYFESQENYETEKYPWEGDLPGTINVPLAEKYWINRTEGFTQEGAYNKLNGFLFQLERVNIYDEKLTDAQQLMELYEKLIPQSKKKYKLLMISHYILYNLTLKEELRRTNFRKVIESNEDSFDEPSIEELLTYLIVNRKIPYEVEIAEEIYLRYQKRKYNNVAVRIPIYLELIIMLNLTNEFYEKEKSDKYEEWLRECILNISGNIKLQEYLISYKKTKSLINIQEIVSKRFFLIDQSGDKGN